MAFDSEIADATAKMDKALAAMIHDFKHLRTGRASVAMIEHVNVEAYGAFVPISQVGGLSVPDASQIVIKPWDKSLIKAIEKALNDANLGMTPQSDGIIVRLNVPSLSTERRQQLAGQAKEYAEKCKVSMRNIRRDAIKAIETKGKAEKAPEDQTKKAAEKISDLLKAHETRAEQMLKDKTTDITTF